MVVRTLDGDAEYFIHGVTPLGPSPEFDLGQIVLQLDDTGAPTRCYLWGQAVDQILADET